MTAKKPDVTIPYWAARLGAIGMLFLGVAYTMAAGLVSGIGPWRLLAILLLVASVGVGVACLVGGRRARRGKALALTGALLLGPVGINAAEAGTWTPAPDAPPVYSGMVTGCLVGPTAAGDGVFGAVQGDGGLWCVLSIFGLIGATTACIVALAALIANPLTWVFILGAVGACDFLVVGALIAALATCTGTGGGDDPTRNPELDT